ncbi:PEP/pyruvate-binding domain-containing protein [Fibrobacterota bacterium]
MMKSADELTDKYFTLSGKFMSVAVIFLMMLPLHALQGQTDKDLAYLKETIQSLKKDPKGPFSKIQWYCPDGLVLPASGRCKTKGGIQHAALKPEVEALQKKHHLFLGQILAGTKNNDFLDSANGFSRMKQYQIEQYLKFTDNGWVMRKAQYYRGAYQIEDEEEWSLNFLIWLLETPDFLKKHFYTARQLVRDLPLSMNEDLSRNIRITSKAIADLLPEFMDLRVKIHSHPDSQDIHRVREFIKKKKRRDKASDEKLGELVRDLAEYYHYDPESLLRSHQEALKGTFAQKSIDKILVSWNRNSPREKIDDMAGLLWHIRKQSIEEKSGKTKLHLLLLSLDVGDLLIRTAAAVQPVNLKEWLELNYALGLALAGGGFLEIWEWEKVSPGLSNAADQLSGERLQQLTHLYRRIVEWGVGMVDACYASDVQRFCQFEPSAKFFIDEKVRSSLLFAAGKANNGLSEMTMKHIINDETLNGLLPGARGVNPGIAFGALEVIDDIEPSRIRANGIYVFPKAPQDLKPVAGILSVSEGNPISHIQLLARNLGIPNAVITREEFNALKRISNKKVLLSVTPRASVWLKPDNEMTAEEAAMVAKQERDRRRITIGTKKLDLRRIELDRLLDLRSKHSGRICGPKAAHLGELRHMFPDKVAPGFIIPFGVFRAHMEQRRPGKKTSYWQYLQDTFGRVENMEKDGHSEDKIEHFVLERMKEIRKEIETISLKPDFQASLARQFQSAFGAPIGNTAVFIRSDTNMEDLKEFTGAGLNLTVPNVKAEKDIINAIRQVWASPFSERSYLWRQKYLKNALDVYPSILILQSVNSEKSGVLITKDFVTDDKKAMTITFSRGVGGAVAGQSGESYVVSRKGEPFLLSPARDADYVRLPDTGGLIKKSASFEIPILDKNEIKELYELGKLLRQKLARSGMPGPYDIELGITGEKIWLFQARPLAESKGGRKYAYLHSLDDKLPVRNTISLKEE